MIYLRCSVFSSEILSHYCWICCSWKLCTPSISASLPTHLPICPFVYLFAFLSICLSNLSALAVSPCNRSHLSFYPLISLFVYLQVSVSICLYLSQLLLLLLLLTLIILWAMIPRFVISYRLGGRVFDSGGRLGLLHHGVLNDCRSNPTFSEIRQRL